MISPTRQWRSSTRSRRPSAPRWRQTLNAAAAWSSYGSRDAFTLWVLDTTSRLRLTPPPIAASVFMPKAPGRCGSSCYPAAGKRYCLTDEEIALRSREIQSKQRTFPTLSDTPYRNFRQARGHVRHLPTRYRG